MKPLTDIKQALECLLKTKKTSPITVCLSGTKFIEVAEPARNRYGYQVPVLISQMAYQRCVSEPSERDNDRGESLWLFKVLALAKYAMQQCVPGATLTEFMVPLNDHEIAPTKEPIKVLVYLGVDGQPCLLIKHVSEISTGGLDHLMEDLASIRCVTQETV